MERLNDLPRWIAEPWHDAEETDDPVGQTKKWLEVAEAILERLAIGAVTHTLRLSGENARRAKRRVAGKLAQLRDRRASFGDWVELLAAAEKGPPELHAAVLGVPNVPPFDRRTACARATGLVTDDSPAETSLLTFFGRLALARNSFAHGHASRDHCEALADALREALGEVVAAVPHLSGEDVCSVDRIQFEAGQAIVDLYPERGTGRPRRAQWRTTNTSVVSAWSESTHVLWRGEQHAPVHVPRWLLHRNGSERLLPWQGGARNDDAFYYVDRAEEAGAHSQVKLDDPELRRDFEGVLERLGYDATAESTAARDTLDDAEEADAHSNYRLAVNIALSNDGLIDAAERAQLRQLASRLGLTGEDVDRVEREAVRDAVSSSAPPPVAPIQLPAVNAPPAPLVVAPPPPMPAQPRRARRVVALLFALLILGGSALLVSQREQLTELIGASAVVSAASRPPLDWVDVAATPGVAGFAVTRTEVTVAQYAACVTAGACAAPHWDDEQCVFEDRRGKRSKGAIPARIRGDDQPVTCIDFSAVNQFAAWAGARLPTMAEWQVLGWDAKQGDVVRAAIADTCTEATVKDERGSGCGTFGPREVCAHGRRGTLGLCDIFGNVFEWVAPGPTDQTSSAIFGGGWTTDGDYTRLLTPEATRDFKVGSGDFAVPGAGLGFRLARSL